MTFITPEVASGLLPPAVRLRVASRLFLAGRSWPHAASSPRRLRLSLLRLAVLCLLALGWSPSAFAEVHPAVPAFNSVPGAPYTIYLDFGGFTFNGNWGNNASYTPGTTPAYDNNGNATTFSSTELANIKNVWSRVSEKYSAYNVNVTTVDPAVAAGQSGTDLARQNYYDSQARMMHTVVGGPGGWTGGGGISYVGVTQSVVTGSNGYHTDWVFSAQAPNNLQFVGEASAHENGHGLKLSHQSDYSGTTLLNEYSSGTGTGLGSKAPIMGNSYSAARGTWRVGPSHVPVNPPQTQNDAQVLLTNSGIGGFVNDGVGHSVATASSLPINGGNAVDATLAKGIIVPSNNVNPVTSGEANYVSDFWSFTTGPGLVSFTTHAGRETITPGVSDPGATLDATMRILNSSGTVIATAATGSLDETISMVLGMGNYYVQVSSAADPLNSGYYDMGSYFLTGSVIALVPEPSTWALLASGLIALGVAKRRRRRA